MPTTIFTDPEYGCVGLSEEDAVSKFGRENVKCYHRMAKKLESALMDEDDLSYYKVVCLKNLSTENDKQELVLGMHYLGKHAGEVIQGYTLGLTKGMTKQDLDSMIGIHPTVSEDFNNVKKDALDQDIDAGSC